MTKDELLLKARSLNGDDKKYEITVEGDKIITRAKWMDATFFAPESVTDEVREFEYIVQIHNNGKYSELTKSLETTKGVSAGGLSYGKKGFIGKEITFNKTIGLGKDNLDGSVGIVEATFNSEEYKAPVRNLLKENGYKMKMGATGKIMIGAAVFAALILAVVLFAFVIPTMQKEALSVDNFIAEAEDFGYMAVDTDSEGLPDEVTDAVVVLDEEDDYQVEFYVLEDNDYAARNFDLIAGDFERMRGNGSISTTSSSKYQKCTVKTSGSYMCVVRVDNTLVYVNAPKKSAEEIKAFLKKIGY